MIQDIFVNLAVTDLSKSRAFWNALGFEFNEKFSNEQAASLVLGEHMYAMLLTKEFFQTFTDKKIIEAKTEVQVLTALGIEAREEVDTLIEKAVAAGGRETRDAQDYGWMYSRALEDLDGHIWELVYMDISQYPGAEQKV